MRVLFCEVGHHGGSVKRLLTLLRGLDQTKYQPGVLTFFRTGAAARLLDIPGVFPHASLGLTRDPAPDPLVRGGRVSWPTIFALRYLWQALGVLRQQRPNIVYLNNTPYSHLPMIVACLLLRLPFICHMRDSVRLTRADRWSLKRASRVVVLSNAALELYASQGVDRKKLRVVYNGISPEELDRELADTAAPGRPQARNLLLTGSLIPRKRQLLALQALERLVPDFPDVRLTLLGDGPDRGMLETWVHQHGLEEHVRMVGWTDDVRSHLAGSRVGLMVSDREGMPNVVLEYMAASLPVVATDLPGLREMVTDGQTGLVVEPGDVEALVRSLRILLSDEAAARQMGERGRAVLASGRFTVAEEHHRLTDLLDEVGAETRSVPDPPPAGALRVSDAGTTPAMVEPHYRIALVESGSGVGGTAKCVHDWLECFDLSRREFHVFARNHVGWYSEIAQEHRAKGLVFTGVGLPTLTAGSWLTRYTERFLDLLRMGPTTWRYFRQFRRLGIDLVHTNNNLFGQMPAIVAARLASLPVICHLHDQVPLTWIERRAVPLADLFFVLSREAHELYGRWIPAGRLEIVPNGLLLSEQWRVTHVEERAAPPSLSVGVVGRLVEWKGHETLVRAFPRIRARVPGARLFVIGDDPFGATDFHERLLRLVTELGCADAVTFTGWLDDPRPLLSRMDVAVCPSLAPEPFGLVVLEAMALGVPVVASRHGGPLDIIDEGRDGLLFQPGDAEDLAEKVVSLLEDPALSRRLAMAAKEKVRSRYALEGIVPRIEAAYDRLLRGASAP